MIRAGYKDKDDDEMRSFLAHKKYTEYVKAKLEVLRKKNAER